MKYVRPKLLIVLIGACLISSIVLIWGTNRIASDGLERSELARTEEVGEAIAGLVAATMDETDRSLRSLRSNPILLDPDVSDAQRLTEMHRFVHVYKNFSDITVYAPDGSMSHTTAEGQRPEPLENTSWFRVARDTQTAVRSDPHRVDGVPGLHFKVYVPVQFAGSKQPHVLRAQYSFDRVSSRIAGVELGENGKIVLLDTRGSILYDRDVRKLLSIFDDRMSPEFWMEHPKGDYVDASGTDYVYSATTIRPEETLVGEQWTLISFLRR